MLCDKGSEREGIGCWLITHSALAEVTRKSMDDLLENEVFMGLVEELGVALENVDNDSCLKIEQLFEKTFKKGFEEGRKTTS